MANEPLSIRISDEARERFNNLLENGNFAKNGDLLTAMINAYETEGTTEYEPTVRPAIETIQVALARSVDVLKGVGAVLMAKDDKNKKDLDEQREGFEKTNALLQQRIAGLETALAESEERAAALLSEAEASESKNTVLQQQIKSASESANDKALLVDEYIKKNDTLTSIIAGQQGQAAENENLKGLVATLTNEKGDLQRRIDDLVRHQASAGEAHAAEIENQRKALTFDKDAGMLELKQNLQMRLEEQQARYAAALEELQNRYTKIIADYENKVKDLLDERVKPGEKASPASSKKGNKNAESNQLS